jgi:serine/threonine protein kinase
MEQLHLPTDIIAQRYWIIRILGEGGTGITYLAQDLKSGQRLALKSLSLQRMMDWKVIELFEREAKVLSQLAHPAIPQYLEYFSVDTPENRSFYIAQQLAEGKSLLALVESAWHTNEAEVKSIAIQILEILVYLHSQKPAVIHRDIKPQNIIRDKQGRVHLVDFGGVKDTYYSNFMGGSTMVGTYGYMAPEQFIGQAVEKSDLYSLGATLLFLLTHRFPCDLPTNGLKIDFRGHVTVSQPFANWLEKILEPDMADRFSSAEEALQALRHLNTSTSSFTRGIFQGWHGKIKITAAAIALIGTGIFTTSHKWVILNNLGITPPESICQNIDVLKSYLQQVDNPNVFVNSFNQNNLNLPSPSSQSILGCNLINQNTQAIELLLAQGADVNIKDQSSNTPLHILLSVNRYNDPDDATKGIAEMLIAKGANVNAKNYNDETPLHLALLGEYFYTSGQDIIKLLIKAGADVNTRDMNGITPLHLAVQRFNQKNIQLLIAKDANVNAQDNQGKTPLHWAIERFDENRTNQIPVILITNGAKLNIKDKNGETPLAIAKRMNNNKAIELLKIMY